MRVTIFEYSGGGHRLTYVRQMLAALADHRQLEISVALSSLAAESDAFEHQVRPWMDRVAVHIVEAPERRGGGRPGVLGVAANKLSTLRRAVERTRPERLVLPTADGVAQLLALRPAIVRGIDRIELVVHGAGFAHPAGGLRETIGSRGSLGLLARVPGARLHFVNALGCDYLHDRGHPVAGRSDVLPDPVDAWRPRDRGASRRALGLPEGQTLIVSAGMQDKRKGIHFLLRALGHLPEEVLGRTRLVLAGRCAADIAGDLAAMPARVAERLIRIDRYLSDDELADALSAADLVATCHPRHMGLSNIALRAASLERPVLASDWGWLGSIVPRFGLGWTGPISKPEAYAGTIVRAIEGAAGWAPSAATRRLIEFHHPDNFRANILGWFGIGDGGLGWSAVRGLGG